MFVCLSVCLFVYSAGWLVPCILVSIQNNRLPAAGLASQALFFSRRRSLPVSGLRDEIPPQARDENVGGDLGSRAVSPSGSCLDESSKVTTALMLDNYATWKIGCLLARVWLYIRGTRR